jgi:hypothetical protein
MKTLVLAAAIALAAATPALARSPKIIRHPHAAQHVPNANASFGAADPIGVYVNGREIGRDPDANIRQTLQSTYYGLQGH